MNAKHWGYLLRRLLISVDANLAGGAIFLLFVFGLRAMEHINKAG